MKRPRLDELLVRRGLAADLREARALVRLGRVEVEGRTVDKPGTRLPPSTVPRVRPPARRYVSRGGEKLAGAIADLHLPVAGRRALDLGASTGGFTDCLLQAGALVVVAVDVGRGLLDWRLRNDPRVHVLEGVHAARLERLPLVPDLVVGDLSFIGLGAVLPAIARLAAPDADVVLLVKPQFELPASEVAPGGRVPDPALALRAVDGVAARARELGFTPLDRAPSRLPGRRAGNVEWFLHLRGPGPGRATLAPARREA